MTAAKWPCSLYQITLTQPLGFLTTLKSLSRSHQYFGLISLLKKMTRCQEWAKCMFHLWPKQSKEVKCLIKINHHATL